MLKFAAFEVTSAVLAAPGMSRTASLTMQAHRAVFDYEPRPGFLYVRSRAISSRCNDNFDEFPAEELEKAYASFKGKPVFVNHVNHDHKRARGVIIDAALHKDANRDGSKDWWVEVLMEVDAVRFPKLAKEILAGNIARTSMGCDVAFSVCSACGNKATTPAEYCQHIPGSKGMMLYRRTASGQKVGEIIRETCYGLKFFENSLLVEPPADPTAHFLGVDTRGLQTTAGANGGLPEGLTFNYRDRGDSHVVTAHHPEDGEIGRIAWWNHERPGPKGGYCRTCQEYAEDGSHEHPAGEVEGIEVDPEYRRRGVGGAMWNYAHSLGVEPPPVHSVEQTDMGKAWAQHVGKRIDLADLGLKAQAARKTAYGEQKAPMDVDTLREDACPVCGDRDTFDGDTCEVCGYVAPPKIFQDPDLEKARQMDLRKDIAEFNDPANPNQIGPDGQPVEDPMDPNALDENGNPINPDAADQDQQPGTLPGEVQAEVQPGGDPMDPNALGEDGQIPDEDGEPVDPSLLGPDGQPLGQQQMTLPDGTPIGPQELPADATTNMGQPFTPGPNMPEGPGEPEGPEGPETPEDQDEDGQPLDPDAGQGMPGTPGDGVADLMCPNCGFTAEAAQPTSVDMDTQTLPNEGVAQMDGVQAGDVCPNCGSAQLLSPAEVQGETSIPMPV